MVSFQCSYYMYMHLLFSIVKRDFPSLIGFAFLLARMRTAGKTVVRKISFLVHDAGNVEQKHAGFLGELSAIRKLGWNHRQVLSTL